MKIFSRSFFGLLVLLMVATQIARSQEKSAPSTVQVHMVITAEAPNENEEAPVLRAENVQVSQGKNMLNVASIIAARGDHAALQLFVLIDDTCDSSIGNNLNDLRDFINAQPASTVSYCLKTNGGPLTLFALRSTDTSTRSAILMKGIPLFIP